MNEIYKTLKEIDKQCEKFRPGDKVIIYQSIRDGEFNRSVIVKTEATILERYPHFLLVLKGQFKECFTYADIALFGVLEKKKGRKKNERRKENI